ncbi:ATP-binding protein [Pseudomonas sp. HY7a-MNA-CIBAN-0227]|uniref:ATP-binding protein n=1 Tax=Pseudomonas sp. HY7a-MNA-CIBAN-0227 TaxID=3140474 RepID=UPI0033308CD4
MKHSPFIRPLDSSFSTPKAARKLLHMFALALVFGTYAGAYSYLHASLDEEISSRRSNMNDAISDAQNFFITRQTLLKSVGLAAVRNITQPLANANEIQGEEAHIILGERDSNTWSLWLTRRLLSYMGTEKINLLYVSASAQAKVIRLFDTDNIAEKPSVLSRPVLNLLARSEQSQDVWVTDQQSLDAPLYIFSRLDDRDPASGWLGLEVEKQDLVNALHHENAGDFLLLDASNQVLYSSAAGLAMPRSLKQLSSGRAFGLVGGTWFPRQLAIIKQLGYSDWRIVYATELTTLLPPLLGPLLICLFICISVTWLMGLLVIRIDRRLIIPAGHRIEALVESEAFSRAVIQIAPIALCVLRRQDGEVVLENQLSQQLLGPGNERKDLCHGWIHRAFSDLEKNNTDELQMSDGRHLSLSFAATRYKREDVLICAFSDISTRKQTEVTLEQARQLADAANQAKTLFLATMSHEIRTPLYGVLGTLELLARTQLSTQQTNYLSAIEGSSANLLHLICDVLDVSRIEAGQLSLELVRFSPLQLIEDVIQSYAGAAHGKGLQLFACIDPQLPDWVKGDVARIRQILNNLLNNALKFTCSGRITLRVKLDSRDDERAMLHWQVADTGKGISHEDQQHLFEPFYQGDGNTNVVTGAGLGLSICKRLMHLMNGTMRVVSEPGLGSSFTLCLALEQLSEMKGDVFFGELCADVVYVVSPVRELAESVCGWLRRWGARAQICASAAYEHHAGSVLVELHPGRVEKQLRPQWTGPLVIAASDEHDAHHIDHPHRMVNINRLSALHRAVSEAQGQLGEQELPQASTQVTFNLGMRVLVVEDNLINQLILRDQLEELGCTVELANDGLAALEAWRVSQFDLILSDLNMPHMNGYELCAKLRELGCSVPVIGATANAIRDENERWLAVGMNYCLVKPFTLRTLYSCLQPYRRSEV